MGFAEALSDDGSLTGRGHPWVRGLVCGLMTTLGGIGHTLPFLIPSFRIATIVAVAVVIAELGAIAWVRHRYMESPWVSATLQVVLGGTLVFVAGDADRKFVGGTIRSEVVFTRGFLRPSRLFSFPRAASVAGWCGVTEQFH